MKQQNNKKIKLKNKLFLHRHNNKYVLYKISLPLSLLWKCAKLFL